MTEKETEMKMIVKIEMFDFDTTFYVKRSSPCNTLSRCNYFA